MKKHLVERFINKYHLNGVIDSAVWIKSCGTLQVKAMSSDRKLFAGVTWKNFDGIDDAEFGILDTRKLLALLKAIPSEDVLLDIVKHATGEVAAMTFSAAKSRMQYRTSSLNDIDGIPAMKRIPPFNVAIKMDAEFIDWFMSAYTAMGNHETLFTVVMSKQTGNLEVVLNYQERGHSDSLYFQPDTVDDKNAVKAPLSFTAKHLKELLKANPEFKDPALYVSDSGLASVPFSEDDLDSEYYLVNIKTEE